MPNIEPFIRWAGGKTWLIGYIKNLISNIEVNHYHEPFIGGGAVFFSLIHKKRAYISDINEELIDTYLAVKNNPQETIDILCEYENSEEEYYRIRALRPEGRIERAARFIYLNQTSYNGLYRVNKNGDYNVPYGHRTNWHYDPDRIHEASKILKNTNVSCGDFTKNKYKIQERDLVFLDPPYTVSHNNNGFIEYNRDLFSIDDQYRLNSFINYVRNKGAYYILTNAAHPAILDIFNKEEDRCVELTRNSLIGGKNAARQEVSEYVFTNIPEVE